ncbi:MAG: hypothetical protein QOF76_4036, partial [Solirubrobacteraceae bacterium]|nr:hypothetical protein [Solirubrobacteraceae bacterium]
MSVTLEPPAPAAPRPAAGDLPTGVWLGFVVVLAASV